MDNSNNISEGFFEVEPFILEIINQLNLNGFIQQQKYASINEYQMKNKILEYTFIHESQNKGIASYLKNDGSEALIFNIFCEFSEIKQILFPVREDIIELYYDVQNYKILVLTKSQFKFINNKGFSYESQSQKIPLPAFLKQQYQKQQDIFNQLGLTSKYQLRMFSKIPNERLKIDLIELFRCLDDKLQLLDLRFKKNSFAYYTQSIDFNQLEGLIIGPKGSLFEGQVYTLSISIPDQYPYQSPKINFNQEITHPLVNEKGEFQLDILQGDWSSVLTIQEVLEKIVKSLQDIDYFTSVRIPQMQDMELYQMVIKEQCKNQGNQNVIVNYEDFEIEEEIQENKNEYQFDFETYYDYYDDNYYSDLSDEILG